MLGNDAFLPMSNDAFLARDFIRGDPKLEVALAMAEECHRGQFRKDGTAYIEHPKLACNLLDWLGIRAGKDKNPEQYETLQFQKAVTLLHDVFEECPKYIPSDAQLADLRGHFPDPDKYEIQKQILTSKYQRKLRNSLYIRTLNKMEQEHGPLNAEDDAREKEELKQWADKVLEGVQGMTNSTSWSEDRRIAKVEEAIHLAEVLKPVRSAEQTASIIADIIHSRMEGMPNVKSEDMLDRLKKGDVSLESLKPVTDVLRRLKGDQIIAHKSFDVSRALWKKNKSDDFIADPVKRTYHELNERTSELLTELQEMVCKQGRFADAAPLQQAFNIEETLEQSYEASTTGLEKRAEPRWAIVVRYERGEFSGSKKGLTEFLVPAERTGRVISYAMYVEKPKKPGNQTVQNSSRDKEVHLIKDVKTGRYHVSDPARVQEMSANDLSGAFLRALEEIPGVRVHTEDRVGSERYFTIEGQLRFDTFIEIAKEFHALDADFLEKIMLKRQKDNSAKWQDTVAANSNANPKGPGQDKEPLAKHRKRAGMSQRKQSEKCSLLDRAERREGEVSIR